ncbi:putative quercetin 2,3-dioxygenase [Acidocella aquatica]|uniref:Quercetin 2,3-dioxygenase n=1 Tax=Acidocella aquatica TaxID=1922313 RepID=A0ABQ6A3I5_9PROT|nr:pirin-like bicupin family protein [Acidocella aquatica]GLR67044.1 putative quercetin 2,3-dioxygenase [Acidocella aquatica]
MIDVRPFSSLGAFRNEWLNARHHFSFGDYHDRARMGFGRLRVWNDDEIAPGTGFGAHPHRDMEIVTFIRQGAITHKDSLGNVGATRAGDVQVMHAGQGITHSEHNLEEELTRLFQIWIIPDRMGVEPGWGTKEFPRATGQGLSVLASGRTADADSGALPLYADAAVLAARMAAGERTPYRLLPGRAAYLVAASGEIRVNGVLANARDGVALREEPEVEIEAVSAAEIVLVDVRDGA